MTDCTIELKRTVPLYRVVAGAIVDTREDIGRVQQTYSHWASRGLKKLVRETLKTGIQKVTLAVNRGTNTATLPPDFHEETFVGVIVDGKKIPLKLRPEIADSKGISDIPCEDKCEKCQQDKGICEDLTITEETVIVVIGNSTYEQTIIKKLYPDGRYFLETRIPVLDIETDTVVYRTTKEFVTSLDLKPCGCIDDTEENIAKIKCNCYDVYCQYYAPCDNSCTINYGGYRIFEETGLIQFDAVGAFSKVYMEYRGFMNKKNGQYQVPEIAFETLVEWVKYKSIQNKIRVPDRTIDRWFENYRRERSNMEKIMGRIKLSQIIQAIGLTPKFDIDHYVCEPTGVGFSSEPSAATAGSNGTTGGSSGGTGGGGTSEDDCGTTTVTCPPGAKIFTPFDIATIAGNGGGTPVPGTNVYQDNKLIGAMGVNNIIVNNTNETIQAGQFALNTVTGTITRYQGDGVTPNLWQSGDILIVTTFFKLI